MTGWIQRTLQASTLLLCISGATPAAETPSGSAGDATNGSPGVEDEEFLAFLGGRDDARGHWQNPLEFDDPAWPTQVDAAQEKVHE